MNICDELNAITRKYDPYEEKSIFINVIVNEVKELVNNKTISRKRAEEGMYYYKN